MGKDYSTLCPPPFQLFLQISITTLIHKKEIQKEKDSRLYNVYNVWSDKGDFVKYKTLHISKTELKFIAAQLTSFMLGRGLTCSPSFAYRFFYSLQSETTQIEKN